MNTVDLIFRISDAVCVGADRCSEEAGVSVIIFSLVKAENNILCLSLGIGNHELYKYRSEIGNASAQTVLTGDRIKLSEKGLDLANFVMRAFI